MARNKNDYLNHERDKIESIEQQRSDELEGLEKNYEFAKGYMQHNADHMDSEALENMKEKQQNRRDKLNKFT
jgi:hypothetical protein